MSSVKAPRTCIRTPSDIMYSLHYCLEQSVASLTNLCLGKQSEVPFFFLERNWFHHFPRRDRFLNHKESRKVFRLLLLILFWASYFSPKRSHCVIAKQPIGRSQDLFSFHPCRYRSFYPSPRFSSCCATLTIHVGRWDDRFYSFPCFRKGRDLSDYWGTLA